MSEIVDRVARALEAKMLERDMRIGPGMPEFVLRVECRELALAAIEAMQGEDDTTGPGPAPGRP